MKMKSNKRILSFFLCFVLVATFFVSNKIDAYAQTTGTGDGTYDFGSLGAVDSGGTGFKTQGDKFVVSNSLLSGGTTLYLNNTSSGNIVIKAENSSTMKTFSLSDLTIGMYAPPTSSFLMNQFNITLKDYNGNVLGAHTFSGSQSLTTADFNISSLPFSSTWPSGGYNHVSAIEISYTHSEATSNFEFRSIALSNISTSLIEGASTATASAFTLTPVVGVDDAITLTVKDSLGNTDTAFDGDKTVTITGYEAAPDNTYGSFNGTALESDGSTDVAVTFTHGVATANLKLNKADAQTIGFSIATVTTPATNTLTITPTHGTVASMAVTQDITAPASNGGQFAQQPSISIKDAYGNTCTSDNATVITAAKEDAGTWTLTGTTAATASSGVASFTNLGATNTAAVSNAQLGFTATGLAKVTSTTVSLPEPAGPAALAIDTTNPSDGTVGTAYAGHIFTATGGTGSKTYAVTAGSLPAGLSLAANGNLTGTPTASGNATFTVTATDSASTPVTNSHSYSMTINPAALAIDTTNPSDGTVGTAYAGHTFTATGGTGSKSYAVTAGSLPAGLSLAANGNLTGTPTTAGNATFTVTATDSASTPVTDSHSYSMTINPAALAIDTTNPSAGTVGTAYAGHIFTATGGTGSKTYAVTAGSLPAGLSLAANGNLTGTPTTAGNATFTVTATDSASTPVTDSHSYSMTINPAALAIDTTNPSAGTVGTAYAGHTFTATGGTGAKTYAVTAGTLPAGLSLASNGTLSGTPTASGNATFTVTVTDSASTPVTDSHSYSMTINPAALAIDTTNPSAGTVGTAYAGHIFTATGGTGSKTYAVTAGSLPAGLSLAANGNLTGTPTTAGNATFTVTATDSASTPVTDSHSYSMTINPAALAIDTTNPSAGTVGTAYAGHTFTATGGTGAKTYAVTAGTLPAGLSLASNGTLSGTPTASGNATFTVTVTDSASTPVTDSHSYTISINAAISSDATLKASSTVKGQTVTSLGIPNGTLSSEIAGAVTITTAKAADTSNAGSFITLFDKNNANATVKVVKYASGTSTANFATDTAYVNEVISNGDFFIIKVIAQDTTTVNHYRVNVTVTTTASGSSSGGGGGSTATGQSTANIVVNGKTENAGTETTSTESGKSTVTVAVDNKTIESKIEEAVKTNQTGQQNVIQVPVADTKSEVVKVALTGDIVKQLETNTFDVSVKRDAVEYIIPAKELTISNVAKELGVAETSLKDIQVEVKITKLEDSIVAKYNEVAKENGATIVFPPTAFEVVAKTTNAAGKTEDVKISKFSNYVERVMEIPSGVDPSKITTGIVFNADGTYSHVPTDIYQNNGKWYARLNSLTNSDYTLVWNPVTVKSVENHWAKEVVNDMASG